MLRRLYTLIFFFFTCNVLFAQLPNGSTAPNWTLTDINGVTHTLYDYLDQGKMVVLDFSATWCGPCWNYHNTHALNDLYNQHGPPGTNEVMVFFIESDVNTTLADLYGTGTNTQGNWVAGTDFPIIDVQTNTVPSQYQIAYFPTIYTICPDRKIYESGQVPESTHDNYITSCNMAINVVNVQDNTCQNDPTGSIDINVSAGYGSLSYDWSNGANTEDIMNLPTGLYSITVTDGNDVEKEMNDIQVAGPTTAVQPQINSVNNLLCYGETSGSATASATGGSPGYTYIWSNGATGAQLSGVGAGTYILTVTDAAGCEETDVVIISEPPPITANASTTAEFCDQEDGTITISAGGGVGNFTYNIGSGYQSSNTFTGLTAGSYSIMVKDGNGCIEALSANVQYLGPPLASSPALETIDCSGPIVIEGDGVSPYNNPVIFEWITTNGNIVSGENQENVTVDEQGEYTLIVTDVVTSCTAETSTTVVADQDPPTAETAAPQSLSCALTSVTLDGSGSSSGANFSYEWTTSNGNIVSGGNTLMPVVDQGGNYTLIVTNTSNSCTSTSSVNVTADLTAPAYNLQSSNNITCSNPTSLLSSNTNPNYAVVWSTTNGNIIEVIGQEVEVNAGGVYIAEITNPSNGCISLDSIVVIADQNIPVAEGGPEQTLTCNTSTVTLDGSGSTGQNLTYEWYDENGNLISTEATVDVSAPGTFTLNVINQTNNCTSIDEVIVDEHYNYPISGFNIDINGMEISLEEESEGENLSFMWLMGDGTVLNGPSVSYTYSEEGEYTMCLITNNECGSDTLCSDVFISAVVISVTAEIVDVTCPGGTDGSIIVTADGGTPPYTFEWSNGETGETISGVEAGEYTVTITDSEGVQTVRSFEVIQPATYNFLAQIDSVTCPGGSDGSAIISLTGGTAPYSYQWSTGEEDETLTGVDAGNYTVTVTDNNGCTSSYEVYIDEPGAYSYVVSIEEVSCHGGEDGSIAVEAHGGTPPYFYEWNTGETSNQISGLEEGIYIVTIVDDNSCTSSYAVELEDPEPIELVDSIIFDETDKQNDGEIIIEVEGGSPPYNYQWSDGGVSDTLSGLEGGDYFVTVTDNNGCDTVMGPFHVKGYVSINTLSPSATIELYPNPAGNYLNIQYELPFEMEFQYLISDINGREVITGDHTGRDGSLVLNLSDISSGIYVIRLVTDQGVMTEKFQKF